MPIAGSGAEGDFNVVVVKVDNKAAGAVGPVMRTVARRAVIGAAVLQSQPDQAHTQSVSYTVSSRIGLFTYLATTTCIDMNSVHTCLQI